MKKLLFGMLAIALSLGICLPNVSASPIRVTVDGHEVAFPDEPPYVDKKSNRTMVPAKFVSEKLGANVKWNEALKQVAVTHNHDTITLKIGDNHAQVNGRTVTFDGPAAVHNGRTMVPLRFISEAFHADVDWKPERNQVIITTSVHNVPKATWIWDSHIIERDPDKLINFAIDNQVTSVYLQIDADIAPAVYKDFIRTAKEKRINVEALAGRPDWAYKSKQDQIQKFIAWVQNYNAAVKTEERFDGLHFDIEPYLLPEWKTANKAILASWMDNMSLIEQETRGSGIKIALDVPFWLNTIKVPGTEYSFSAWLLEKFDCLVIMDYRNFALGKNGIVENASAMMRQAATLKKQVIVAVETAKNMESDRTSFYAKGIEAMEKELQAAHQKLSRHSSYAGFAIHDYKSWAAMK
ncbi:copper amine oxidase N-terminal domain-containing protein [Paenibacillus melissococcoides]|uniref:Copper amine oxidase N-terminal domain-containing protein n=1 Tax=Paenibacillus melissococcoides TaxID=2912268 RepID=A0ABM9G8G5_9BACL|nr:MULTISPECIES: copper amine oxidase N-terminal domain-containing protein [Paenibacillus]CAH8248241.1 copper amine oxidase N-terminal domain-containing protein [Paenibacillus melissococcoides]